MNSNHPDITALAGNIARAESKLQELEWEIEEIGQPAAHELQRRLDALIIEQTALKRNLAEWLGREDPGDTTRLRKIEALLDYIQTEEDSLKEDADFLNQSGPTSSEFAVKAGSKLVELVLHALNRVVGDHHPLGQSVFVNHSHKQLAEQYGLTGRPGEADQS